MSSDRPAGVKGYEVFFGFREPPFSLAPDTRFLFDGASHAGARDRVAYALERREPLVVVTGEIGTGKTLLCRSVVEKLEHRTFLSIVHDPMLERDDLLKQMLQDFGVISKDRTRLAPTTRHELVHALQEFLLALVPLHAHAVLVIDEAQHLQPDVLEQLRLISNVHDAGGTLLQIVLVGQPSLEAVLSRPELRQLKQRVSRHVRLEPLGIAELSQYIDHRLAVARNGASSSHGAVTFAPEALSAIWRLSGGTPRVINLLCDRALEAAYEQQAHSVGGPLVDAAAAELGLSAAPIPAVAARGGAASIAPAPPEAPAPPTTVAPLPAAAVPPPAAVPSAAPSSSATENPWASAALEEVPIAFGGSGGAETPAPRPNRLLLIAAVVVVSAAAVWFGVRFFPSNQGTAASQGGATPATQPAPAAPAPAAAPPASAAPPPAASPPSPTTSAPAPAPVAAAPSAASPTASPTEC